MSEEELELLPPPACVPDPGVCATTCSWDGKLKSHFVPKQVPFLTTSWLHSGEMRLAGPGYSWYIRVGYINLLGLLRKRLKTI